MAKKNQATLSENGEATKAKTTRKTSAEDFEKRRDFLKIVVAAGIGVCAIGTPICAGARLILAPAFQEKRSGKFHSVAELDSLTETPRKFQIIGEKRDAWMNLPDQVLGAVFLRKTEAGVVAFHALCPHAGCSLQVGVKKNPQTGTDEELFYCPCHQARFDLDGRRLNGVAPRDLDTLDVRIEGRTVFVKFEDFTFGIAEKRSR